MLTGHIVMKLGDGGLSVIREGEEEELQVWGMGEFL